ncbi:MAG: hypothetical protein U0572_10255 [Phycisphaerales bacterium]
MLALTVFDIVLLAVLAFLAAALGIWRARRRLLGNRRIGPMRSIVLFRTATSDWDEDTLYGAIAKNAGPIEQSERAEMPKNRAVCYRVTLADGTRIMLIDTDAPYVARRDEAARRFTQPAVRAAIAEHTTWTAIDLLGNSPSETATRDGMALLGKLAAALDDGRTLLLHRRDLNRFALPTPTTFEALERGDLDAAFALPA